MSKLYISVRPDGTIKKKTTMSDDQPDMPATEPFRDIVLTNIKVDQAMMDTLKRDHIYPNKNNPIPKYGWRYSHDNERFEKEP